MYMAEIADIGLTSPARSPATDEKVKQLNHVGLRHLWLSRSDVTDDALRYLAAVPGLSELHLRSTRISDDGLRYFQRARRSARLTSLIRGSAITACATWRGGRDRIEWKSTWKALA